MVYWIDNADSFKCSNCGFECNNPDDYKGRGAYCPSCGAAMIDNNDTVLSECCKIELELEGVDHPEYYNHGMIECIEALKAATAELVGIEAFCTSNAIKYLWRWKTKNGVQDLDKAIWYINYLKEEIKESEKNR